MGTCITDCNARRLLRYNAEPKVVAQFQQGDGWNAGIDPQDPTHVIIYGRMCEGQGKLHERKRRSDGQVSSNTNNPGQQQDT